MIELFGKKRAGTNDSDELFLLVVLPLLLVGQNFRVPGCTARPTITAAVVVVVVARGDGRPRWPTSLGLLVCALIVLCT